VVRLEDQREAALLEALDEPALPQRLRAVELLRVDPRGEPVELLLGAGRRQRAVTDVVLEVEVVVVDPQRPSGLERRVREPLPIARHEVQTRADVLQHGGERRRGTLEDRDRADVHVRARVLLMEERGVHGGESIEVLLRHGASPGCLRWSKSKRIRLGRACNPARASGRVRAKLPPMSVRVLVVALVVQLLLAGSFVVWAATGFPLP
jgi:hypothetical protein